MCSKSSSCPCSCPAKNGLNVPDGACAVQAAGPAAGAPLALLPNLALAPNGVAVSPAFPMGRNNAVQTAAFFVNASGAGSVSVILQGSLNGQDWETISTNNANTIGCTWFNPDTGITWSLVRVVIVGPNATVLFGPIWIWRQTR